MRVAEYFPDHELACHCGCGLLPIERSVERLYVVRCMLRKPLPISSAARCKVQNAIAGGKVGSIHLMPTLRKGNSAKLGGGAFDIIAKPSFQAEIYAAALLAGFKGFGFADTFIHIDDADRPDVTIWRYTDA